MQKRYYTVEEANAMVPQLEEAFTRILQMRHQIAEIHQMLDLVDAAPEHDDFDIALPDADPSVIHNRGTLKALTLAVREDLEQISASGCLIKGIDAGLIDWYAKRNGRDVFLCWKLGEQQVGYWHDTREGFSGRRPIEELFDADDQPEADGPKTAAS